MVMKLKLDMSCHLLNVYTKFEIDISEHIKESPENPDGRTSQRHNTTLFQMGV